MTENPHACIFCGRTSSEVPVLAIEYRDEKYYICPEHFPILIHKPQMLAGKLPGAENLAPHEH